jgi:hypothetical protein
VGGDRWGRESDDGRDEEGIMGCVLPWAQLVGCVGVLLGITKLNGPNQKRHQIKKSRHNFVRIDGNIIL